VSEKHALIEVQRGHTLPDTRVSEVLRVLIVEDDPNDAELVARTLGKDAGVHAVVVTSGQELRMALEDEEFNVAASDVVLPGFSADEALTLPQTLGPPGLSWLRRDRAPAGHVLAGCERATAARSSGGGRPYAVSARS
jgi:CheY-like chemotaxis protein